VIYLILICEPQFKGFEHSQFNAALITAVNNAFPNEKILFLSEKDHMSNIRKILDKNSIKIDFQYEEINVIPQNLIDPIRFPRELILFNHIFNIASKFNSNKVIISNIRRPSIVSIKLLIRKFKDINCYIVLHGILESIHNSPLKLTEIPFWFHFWLSIRNIDRLRYIVLGDSIKEELLKKIPSLESYILSIDHPYFFSEENFNTTPNQKVVRFGFFGFGSIRKGIDLFFKLSNNIKNMETRFKPEFILIGSVQNQKLGPFTYKKVDILNDSSAIIPSHKKPLSMEDFEMYAKTIDYALILHSPQENSLTPMASFFDALSYLKPIIALKNPFLKYYFNQMGGIGYLCKDYYEIENLILQILNDDLTETYDHQRNVMLNQRKKLSLEIIGKKLARMWD